MGRWRVAVWARLSPFPISLSGPQDLPLTPFSMSPWRMRLF